MSEEFLNGTQVRPFFEHMCTECVPQGMRVDIGRESACHGDGLYNSSDAARRQRPAAQVDQQSRGRTPARLEDFLSCWQVFPNCNYSRFPNRYQALFFAFAANPNELV